MQRKEINLLATNGKHHQKNPYISIDDQLLKLKSSAQSSKINDATKFGTVDTTKQREKMFTNDKKPPNSDHRHDVKRIEMNTEDLKELYTDELQFKEKLEVIRTETENTSNRNHILSKIKLEINYEEEQEISHKIQQQSERNVRTDHETSPKDSSQLKNDIKQEEEKIDRDHVNTQSVNKLNIITRQSGKTTDILDALSKKRKKSPVEIPEKTLKKGRPPSEKKYHECDICKRTFTKSSNLITHMRVHTGEKPFVCEVCKKGFTQSSSLITHRRIHTGEQPYGCDVCEKRFSESCALTKHKMSHTGVKPYGCKLCEKSFSRNVSLTRHMTIHTGKKPYVCLVCSKGFSQNHTLSTHMRSHTGYKPFVCEICEQAFTQKCNLISHKRMHTGEKPFVCSVCDKSFRDSSQLSRHAVIHSGLALMCEVMLTE